MLSQSWDTTRRTRLWIFRKNLLKDNKHRRMSRRKIIISDFLQVGSANRKFNFTLCHYFNYPLWHPWKGCRTPSWWLFIAQHTSPYGATHSGSSRVWLSQPIPPLPHCIRFTSKVFTKEPLLGRIHYLSACHQNTLGSPLSASPPGRAATVCCELGSDLSSLFFKVWEVYYPFS